VMVTTILQEMHAVAVRFLKDIARIVDLGSSSFPYWTLATTENLRCEMLERTHRARKPTRRKILLLWCALFIAATQLPVNAQQAVRAAAVGRRAKVLSETENRIVFDSSFLSGPSTAMPSWDRGYMVSWEIETFLPGSINVRLYSRTGQKVREAAFWFPESVRIRLTSAAVTSDGRILASGTADKADGTSAPFIALTDLAGRITDVIQTQGFYPGRTCAAPDGTVWSFGSTGYDAASKPRPGETVRHFDFQKGQIGAYIARSEYPDRARPDVLAFIRCSENGVAIYSPSGGNYVEIDYGSGTPRRYRSEIPAGLSLTGFAFIASKETFGYLENQRSREDSSQGIYTLDFDEAAKTARWVRVDSTGGGPTGSGVRSLWGADGEHLVLSRGGDPAGQAGIHWATPLDR
jgi:hypothetical protein